MRIESLKVGMWPSARVCAVILGITSGWSAHAQQAVQQPYQEYDKQVRSAEQVGALTSDLFGDAVNVYDQSTSFQQTDIDLRGTNALPVRLSRKLSVRPIPTGGMPPQIYGGAGDWNVDVPFISGVFDSHYGWIYGMGARKTARCTDTFHPWTSPPHNINSIWSGYTVNLPGDNARTLIGMPPSQFKPTGGQSNNWTTSSLDAISCTAMISGYEGEGFVLQTTEGVKYTFNIGTVRTVGEMGTDSSTSQSRPRIEVYILASRIEDRFGNWVNIAYNGNGHPTSITANDGRSISLQYSGSQLASATANGRTWSYVYAGATLQRVVQPDSASWEFTHVPDMYVDYEQWTDDPGPGCGGVAPLRPKTYSLQIKHPSGAVGSFRFDHGRFYRAGVPVIQCVAETQGGATESGGTITHTLGTPYYFDVLSLSEKTISGPGIAVLRWTYGDSGEYQGMWDGVPPCTTCTQSKVVSITQPDGSRLEETYGIVFGHNEGKLLGRRTVSSSGVVLESEKLTYVSTAQMSSMPFPDRYGSRWGGSDDSSVTIRPMQQRQLTRDDVTMTWQVSSFDGYGRPASVTRSSSQGASRTDTTSYYNDTTLWILGQVASQTNNNSGLVEAQTTYNTAALPTEQRRFGKLVQTLTYHADGSVASVADGRGNATGLSNWKRGTPQLISFADGTSMSASVDDNGWIRSTTNEVGYQSTFDYDPMGRLVRKTFATGDSVAWNPTTQVFERVDAVEHGLAAGHWRLTTNTGNRSKVTWFDAMWRPALILEQDGGSVASTARYQRFSYDHAGRTTFQSYPAAGSNPTAGQWSEFDALGRPTSTSVDSEQGLLTTITAYLSGMRVRTTDPRGQSTTVQHRVYDSPMYDMPVAIEHPGGAFTDIARDVFGKPTSIKRRNATSGVSVTRSYVYNPQQELCKSVEPETGATAMGYDAAGNLAWSAAGLTQMAPNTCDAAAAQASGRRVDRTYDARNRLKQLFFADGSGDQIWSYNNVGQPTQVVTANPDGRQVINTFAYAKRGLIINETLQQTGMGIWSMGYGYDANGAMASLQYPSGLQVTLSPNALGQPTRVGSFATGVGYYPNGALRAFTYGNGVTHSMSQNARGLPARAVDSGVIDVSIAYDKNGNVASITDAIETAKSRQMQYDSSDRLTQANSASFGGDKIYRFTYDVLDNLRSAKLGGIKQHNYWYDARNRMTTVNQDDGNAIIGLDYDVQGNLAKKNGEGFRFDLGNRLRDVGGRETYAYDAHGRRVGSYNAAQGDILSFYGNDGVLRRQHNKRTGKEVEYVNLGAHLIAQVETGVVLATPVVSAPATVATGNYTVSWSSIGNANRYELRVSTSSGSSWSSAYAGSALSYAVAGVEKGTRHYQVRACQGSGCGSWSASVLISYVPIPTATPALAMPAVGLNGSHTINWSAIADASRYVVEEQPEAAAWGVVHDGAALAVTLHGRTAGSYSYRARACNVSGCGPYSAAQAMTVIYPTDTAPTVTAPASSYSGAYTVSWTSVAGSIRYEPRERLGTAAWTNLASLAGTAVQIAGKSTGVYGYQVRACNSAGCGPWSNVVSTSVLLPPSAAPSITLASSSTTGSFPVTWSAVAGAVEYRLEERLGSGAWQGVQAEGSTVRNVSGKATGTWSYRVQACNAGGCGPWSADKGIVVLLVPGAPAVTVPATNSSGAWTVSWSSVPTAASYQLDERVAGGAWANVYDGSAVSKAVSGKASGTYEYRAKACNASGCGGYSTSVSTAVTRPPGAAPVLTVPSSSANGAFTVSWTAVGATTEYRLEEVVSGAWSQIQSGAGTSLGISGRGSGSYSFRVRACNGGGCSGYSGTGVVTVLLPPQSAPSLSAPSSAAGAYSVNWSAVTGATRYSLQQSINGAAWAGAGDHAGTSTSFNPGPSGSYAYRVAACNSSGCGGWSATRTVNVIRAPSAPVITYAHHHYYYAGPQDSEFTSCNVRWTASAGTERYELHAGDGTTVYGQMYSGPLNDIQGSGYSIQYCANPYVVRACNAAGCSGWSAPFVPTVERDPKPENPGEPPL